MYIKVVNLKKDYLIAGHHCQMRWESFDNNLKLKQSLFKMYKKILKMYKKIVLIKFLKMMPQSDVNLTYIKVAELDEQYLIIGVYFQMH